MRGQVALSVVAVAGWLTVAISNGHWQSASIKRGYAEFNQTTGQWQWKEPVKKAEDQP